ncbi:MAG: B12-binding domain-containing radical SAM protein [Gemmatimonadota bacterium]|nr:B12-binding domain-containing radical SAM protein [Gemmatimonadota bacterium]MDH3366468.1 B12-binding domain-containing radical SAM protein [Gemmatimonadota bacterium]MDH3479093.1 B12-binding domain-containing radical SAM protein [Gemmatimonadota bacterium]MDH3571038.1 B12-binding domain-containing radical SAM protein [Gemmatimonadota bacterium]MDH5549210.1 B12-binding domain-containing radical SAM protein [Gemmatimonadota bacterium]
MHCLLIFPEFTAGAFWNYRATCELMGAKYPASPLGLITVAALLPKSWECRLVDCNVQELSDADIDWADIVFTGGMIVQQHSSLALIERLKASGKTVVAGGPDATSSPHLYDLADFLVLGEAEVTLPRWLADLEAGCAAHIYECGEERADMSRSPVPRFDLLQFDKYLHISIQYGRGCPFHCEFCDIVKLFGQVPRLKSNEQILREIDLLYASGHRGHVDFVDDNFIGNKREVKKLLPVLRDWLEAHDWPFEFSTEASINVADDEQLLQLMQDVGFFVLFVGVESPSMETLVATQKRQNTRRSIAESIRKIHSYGMAVNSGYIIGFDAERGSVAQSMLALIEASATPVNMVGLLAALPGTQLTRRLAREGRLHEDFAVPPEDAADQCSGGLNFVTKRPRVEILEDYRRVIAGAYAPHAYFNRVYQMGAALNCRKKKLRLPWRERLRELRGFGRLIWRMGVKKDYRIEFWRTLARLALRNPRALRHGVSWMALYLHFGEFMKVVLTRLDKDIELAKASHRPHEVRATKREPVAALGAAPIGILRYPDPRAPVLRSRLGPTDSAGA